MTALIIVILFLALCTPANAERPVTVYAAASLAGVLEELADSARAQGIDLRISSGGSSTLARQIEMGAPADLYVSANTQWMDYLDRAGLIEPSTRMDLVGNGLVLIASQDGPDRISLNRGFNIADAFLGRVAIADPDHVPGGVYAKQALKRLGWWKRLQNRIAPAVDVRAALALVERGECEMGIVYATDARVSDSVRVAGRIRSDLHEPIVYPIAIVHGKSGRRTRDALDLLASERSRQILRKHGFKDLSD
ncbi:TPA: molybdate ABC transporter substrate-binding protein [Candidatus Latescibacteria bacterium]|nr:molybdate ABC transporter substrate-binding protein [Candidatus Latescibacterota bacterium]